ncbi:C40 family peptidase [uncultured Jatrophihabitans sp.]|uniref:C40 family peptidase n=1 Tax=uncultured Jatrophihabitans sp. TaxID=1610747 RepID=UPI0035CA7F6B
MTRSASMHAHLTRLRRPTAALTAVTGLVAGLATAVVVGAAPASAATTASHNPLGGLSGVTATSTGLTLRGWAVDPDSRTSNAVAFALVDGVTRAVATTSVAYRSVTTKYHAGPTPGFVMPVRVPSGNHTVCVAFRNSGPGTNVVGKCMAYPLGRKVSSATIAKHSPAGVISHASASRSSLHLSGFVTDQDFRSKHLTVVLYVDGSSAATFGTSRTGAGAPAGSGGNASYSVTEPVSSGTHQACLWAVNVGWGHNTFLGCRTLDTRAGQALAAGSPSTAILAKVAAEAKKHIGQPYVWGATGPKKFDCSGLVMYSYKKFGFQTPRISEDQSRAARLIPASHARPGDLVFYHDSQGDVYHVGIYLSPGKTVAAIDEAEGVNYQQIWDPSSTTYGSFTHL